MAGLGKTTLAWKIFRSIQVQYQFVNHFWVSVSQKFSLREVLLQILSRITDQDVSGIMEEDLVQAVRAYLEGRQFLLVIDDVWTVEDWNNIRKVLPKRNSRGRVLITSQDRNVGIHANPTRKPLNLRFLRLLESWKLLQYEMFGKLNCFPKELEEIGWSIASKCDGVPLSVVIVGGAIVDSYLKTKNIMSAMHLVLEKMSRVGGSIARSDGIELSYEKLPNELKNCFLYLGVFPQGYEISVWTLIHLWIAERFIWYKEGKSLEEIAQDNLNDLIYRNLVIAERTNNISGKVKTCYVHDVIHEFCTSKVGNKEQNLFQEIKMSKEGVFDPPVSEIKKYRRLCIHSHVPTLLSQENLESSGVRSLLFFSRETHYLEERLASVIPNSFSSLRVLESISFKFHHLSQNIYKLIHLRYITVSIENLQLLPDSISKLWNLQTLLINTMAPTLEIRANIWKLIQLRHLKTNAAIILAVQGEADHACNSLQTFTNLSPQYCTEEVLNRARNIKKLGIRGRLATLLEGNYSLAALACLENLKMVNDLKYESASENPLPGLPPPSQFPPNLKSLTLSNTYLKWSHMSILGLLENLEVLKLRDMAFCGDSWEAKDGGFRHLEVLHIGCTNLIYWTASHHHYPRLRCLELHNCEKLREVPIGLADIQSFEMLDLFRSYGAADSATIIRLAKQQKLREQNITNGEFKLSIFPLHS